MTHPLAARIEQLRGLNQQQAFDQLKIELQRLPADLPADLPEDLAGEVEFWRGKLAVRDGDIPIAIQQLSSAVGRQQAGFASFALLGAALARQQQWLDARRVLRQALRRDASSAAVRLELAAVELELGEPEVATDLLAPLKDAAAGPLRGLRARAAVQAASEDQQAAASLAAEALRLDCRLPESLLFEWLQTVGGFCSAIAGVRPALGWRP